MSSVSTSANADADGGGAAASSSSVVTVNGRLIVLTGATGTIGGAIANSLSALPNSSLLLAVRKLSDGAVLAASLKKQHESASVFYEQVDLDSTASVKSFAERVGKKYGGKVHVLVNNAAVASQQKKLTGDGVELQFHVNVLAFYQLMKWLQPYLSAGSTPQCLSRVVNVASNFAGEVDISDLNFTRRSYDCTSAYRQSKACDRLLSYALAPAFLKQGITVNCCNPAFVTSNLLRSAGISHGYQTAEEGAATPVFLACSETVEGKTGGFYDEKKLVKCQFQKEVKAIEALWKVCEQLSQ